MNIGILFRESKEKLVSKFYKHAWPFRRNKTLMFGFMYIEKGLSWYKKAGCSYSYRSTVVKPTKI
jgi:hypothetical protein